MCLMSSIIMARSFAYVVVLQMSSSILHAFYMSFEQFISYKVFLGNTIEIVNKAISHVANSSKIPSLDSRVPFWDI